MRNFLLVAACVWAGSAIAHAAAPTVTTQPAAEIAPSSAIVRCTIDLQGENGTVAFEYGTVSGALGSSTPARMLSSRVTSFTARLGSLQPGTPYYFRGVATNADGTGYGSEMTFTTPASGGTTTVAAQVVAVVGQPVPGQVAGVNYASLQVADGPFAGTMTVGDKKVAAIFAADGSVRAQAGTEAPGLTGSIMASLGAPSGDAALAKLKPHAGGVTLNGAGLLLAGLTDGPVRIAARTGAELTNAPGVSVKKFGAIEGQGSVIFFLATLQGAGATVKNSAALCAALADGSVRVIARKGQTLGSSTVATISTLVGASGTLAEGRWRVADDQLGVRITAADKSTHLFIITSTSTDSTDWSAVAEVGDTLPAPAEGAAIKSFGLPGFSSDGPAVTVNLTLGTAGVSKIDDTALLRAASGSLVVIAREGSPAPDSSGAALSGVTFAVFGTPVSGAGGLTAFTATLKGATGVAKSGLWIGSSSDTLKLLARGGDAAPGGGKFQSFTSLALPDGMESSAVFEAKLVPDRSAGITSTNNLGLWAVDGSGAVVRLLSAGDQIAGVAGGTRTVKSFKALQAAPGSIGAANGYDSAGTVAALVTFTDRTVALLELSIPQSTAAH